VVTAIAHTSAEHDRTDEGLHQHRRVEVVGQACVNGIGSTVGFAQLVRRDQIDIVAQQWGQFFQAMNVTWLDRKYWFASNSLVP